MHERTAREHFDEQGFLLLRGLFKPDSDFAGVISAYDRVLDELEAPVSELALSADRIGERAAGLYQASGSLFAQHFDISLPPRPSIPADTPICLDPAIFSLLRHPRLLDAVEALIGPEISLNPVCHVRIKPPQPVMDRGIDQDDLAKKPPKRPGQRDALASGQRRVRRRRLTETLSRSDLRQGGS